jgi:hypothetical protein
VKGEVNDATLFKVAKPNSNETSQVKHHNLKLQIINNGNKSTASLDSFTGD